MTHMNNNVGRMVAVLIVLLLASVTSLAADNALELKPLAGQQGAYLTLDGVEPTSPVTVQARFRIDTKADLDALKGAWLVGLSTDPNGPPTALSITWSEEPSGWFPVWAVQVQSDAGLLASGPSLKRGAGFLEGTSYMSAHTLSPQVGTVYQADLSYDPRTGQASIGLSDITNGNRLFSRSIALEATRDTLYPAIGFVGGAQGMQFEQLVVSPHSVPFGTTWDVMVHESDRYTRLAVFRLTKGYDLALRLGAETQTHQGAFSLVVDNGAEVKTLLERAGDARHGDEIMPFAAADLPYGDITVSLNYTDEGGGEWTLGSRSLLVVAATAEISFGQLEVADDALHGTIIVKSQDETVDNLPFKLLAAVGAPDQKDAESKVIKEDRLTRLSPEASVISFTVPIDFTDRLFSLVMDIEFGVPVGKVMHGNQYHVLLTK